MAECELENAQRILGETYLIGKYLQIIESRMNPDIFDCRWTQ